MKERNLSYFQNYTQDYNRGDSIKDNILAEENLRKIPVRVNSSYGKRPPIEVHDRNHVRVIQTRNFYRKNGVGLNSNQN